MIVIVCPGQGSQTPGFLAPWLELPGLRDQLTALSDAAEVDLVAHGTTSDEDTIKDTAVAQPLLVGAGLLALRALGRRDRRARMPCPAGTGALAGHSVGEITAAAGGRRAHRGATRCASSRCAAARWPQASAATPTGMSAVLGGDPDEVLATIERHAAHPGQRQRRRPGRRRRAARRPRRARRRPARPGARHPAQGRRRLPHALHGARGRRAARRRPPTTTSPTPASRSSPTATARWSPTAARCSTGSWPRCPTRCAGTCAWSGSPTSASRRSSSCRPAGTLVGLAKRALKGVELLAVKTPDDLDAARTLIKEHSA